MSDSSKEKRKKDYKTEILNYIKVHPAGITISDITKGLEASRTTISKYISYLEGKGTIFANKIGAYKLYFSAERDFLQRIPVVTFYQDLLSGLNTAIKQNKQELFKKIGYGMDRYIDAVALMTLNKVGVKDVSYKLIFKAVASAYPYWDTIINSDINVDLEIDESSTIATYKITNVKILEDSKDFELHFYLVTGLVEKALNRFLEKEIRCNIKEITSNSVIFSIEIVKK